MKVLENKIEQLLLNSSFDELTREERERVLAHLSEEEYRSFQRVIFSVKLSDPPGRPMPVTLPAELKKRFNESYAGRRRRSLFPSRSSRVMAVSVAAVIVLFIVFILFAYHSSKSVRKSAGPSVRLAQNSAHRPLKPESPPAPADNPSLIPPAGKDEAGQAGRTVVPNSAGIAAMPLSEEGQKLPCYDLGLSPDSNESSPMAAMGDEIPCLYAGFEMAPPGLGTE